MKPDIAARLANHEDALVERKPEGANSGEIRATACGFANTVHPGTTALIFFGVANDGAVIGVTSPDSLQKTIRRQLMVECYPAIDYQSYVFEHSGKSILAVEIPASTKRPHFTGPAYVRRGSETVPASEQEYDRLIASRNTVAGVLARSIGEMWTIQGVGKKVGDTKPLQQPGYRESAECRIVDVNAHFVRLHHPASGTNLTEELVRAELSYDEKRHRRMLIVRSGA